MNPKILVFDVETSPMEVFAWDLYNQTFGLNQIKQDWFMLAWAAKWLGEPESKVMYMDSRKSKNIADDKPLLKGLIRLINSADIVVTQNGEEFDIKKLNARAIINGLMPTKPVKSTDILKEGRKVFKFTSHKLQYVTNAINKKYKKLLHHDYPGFELWAAIMAGDNKAWKSMETYCKYDVLSTEESYQRMAAWIKTQHVATYTDDTIARCPCGSDNVESRGYAHTEAGKYRIYHCKTCGKWSRASANLLTKAKKQSILRDMGR